MAYVTLAKPLERTYSWHGQIFPAGATQVPESLATVLALAVGDEAVDSGPKVDAPLSSPALTAINAAATYEDLTPLPGIGSGAAKKIIKARPDSGFDSLQHLAELVPEIFSSPYAADLATLQPWEPA